MKSFLLFALLTFTVCAHGQQAKVSTLPSGTYEVQRNDGTKFTYGDLILLDESRYRMGNESTVGEYRFSATAQRVLFLSGVLKGSFARTTMAAGNVAIVLPLKENNDLGIKLADADVLAVYKKK